MKAPFLIGRLLFGGYFVFSGINHFKQRKMLSQYASAKGVPAPDLAVTATGATLILGGASLLLGIKPKLGAAALAGFLAGVSPVMHNFWAVQDPNQRMNDMINFTKNIALLGGAMALMGTDEPWPLSVPTEKPTAAKRVRQFVKRVAA